MVGLKDDGECSEKKKNEGVEKEKQKNYEVATNKEVEEKVVSEKEKHKLKKQATDKGKVVFEHPPVQHLPYLYAPSKKDKERQHKHFLDIFK